MRPPFSVIFLTTLIGTAQGLFIALYGADILRAFSLIDEPPRALFTVGSAVCVALAGAGLAASFFHLGRPARAWRAATMWRTSWLSREVIALPLFLVGVAGYGWAHSTGWPHAIALGSVALAACLALFACTAMIYMCLRFLQEWATPLTLVNFVLIGCASGFVAALPLVLLFAQHLLGGYLVAAVGLTIVALVCRWLSLARNARLRPRSSLQSATGLKGPVVQASRGFTARSYNTLEFFHGATATRLLAIKWTFLALGFLVPAALALLGSERHSVPLLLAAAGVQYVGLLAERWYFFAQVNHPQNLYYQAAV